MLITAGTFADARISSSSVTQHLGSYLTTASGLNASNLTSGTVPDARIAASSITQHTDSKYLRSDAADTATGQLFFDAGFDSHPIMLSGAQNFDNIDRSGFYNLYNTHNSSTNSPGFSYGTMIAIGNDKGSAGFGLQIAHERTGTGMYVRGMNDTASAWSAWAEIWTSTTDGPSSGLDADLLDSQQGSYYLNYNNFTNTPTIPTNNNQLTNGAGYITSSGNTSGTAGGLSGTPNITVGTISSTNISANSGTGVNIFYSSQTSADDWQTSPISIRERGLNGNGSTSSAYAPNLNFHWGSVVSRSLTMLSDGNFVLGEWTSSGAPETTANLATLNTGGYKINNSTVIDSSKNFSGASITVTGTVDGRDVAADGTKLDGIESGATADQTASEILTAIKTVDGSGSGLDADNLDGYTWGDLRTNIDMGADSNTAARYIHIPRGGGITFYGDNSQHHGIFSRNSSNSSSDDLLITSYNRIHFDLDSNNNNTNTEITAAAHGSTTPIFKLDGENAHLTLGADDTTPQINMLFDDHGSGAGWDTRIEIGKSDDLGAGTGVFPTYVPSGAYGMQVQANSDGAFFGIEEYSTGNFRPIIQWGDDNTDTPFRIKHENGSELEVSYNGICTATTRFSAPTLYSTVATGTAPLTVTSTTAVSNLNADMVDGVHASSFLRSDANDTLSSTLKVTGSIIHEFNTSGGYIARPKGAQYVTTTSTVTGAIKIKLPTHGTDDMLSFWVDIYDYDAGESVTMWIGGYLYQTTGNNEWVNETALIFTEQTGKAPENVRFGADGSNNCIWIGETTDTWSYPQVIVRDFQCGYTTDVDAYDDNWAISFVTSFDTVDTTRAAKGPVTEWDRVESKPSFATVATSGSYNDLSNTPTVPTNNNQLTNGAGYTTYTSNQATDTTSSVTFNTVTTSNNGNGTNVRIGDDVWLGDQNIANTMSIRGVQNAANGFIVFGNANTTALGRTGSGALTYGGNTIWHAGNDGSGSGLDADSVDGVGITTSSMADGTVMIATSSTQMGPASSQKFGRGTYGQHTEYAVGGPSGSAASTGYIGNNYPVVGGNSDDFVISGGADVVIGQGGYARIRLDGTYTQFLQPAKLSSNLVDTNNNTRIDTFGRMFPTEVTVGAAPSKNMQYASSTLTVGSVDNDDFYLNLKGFGGNSNIYMDDGSIYFNGTSNSTAGFKMIGTTGAFHSNGDVIAYSSTLTASDRRLKENVKVLENSLEKVMHLQGVKYDWKESDRGTNQIGLIAQEVEEIVPEVVNTIEDSLGELKDMKVVNYTALVPMLIEAVKEQQTIINRLEERLNNLENKGEE